MSRTFVFGGTVFALFAVMFLCAASPTVPANEQTYTPRSEEEVDVISLVVGSEMKANNWSKSELICLSINWLNPTAKLVKSLRQRNVNVRSAAEWAKRFNCGFELQLEYTQLDLSRDVKVRSKVLDLREVNKGEAHIVTLLKDGEYSVRKVEGKWAISEYAKKPLTAPPSP